MLNVLRKLALFKYRIIGLPIMYLFLFGMAFYVSTWGVFSVNRSWVAPRIITSGSAQVSDWTAKLIQYHIMLAEQTGKFEPMWYIKQDEVIYTMMDQAIHGSPYAYAANGQQFFAFVPYSNQKYVFIGSPVYACTGEIVWCHKIATVGARFQGEETGSHPIFFFKGTMRGFLIQLVNVTDLKAMEDSVLFIGHKPLFF
jgi:hypothetical protein